MQCSRKTMHLLATEGVAEFSCESVTDDMAVTVVCWFAFRQGFRRPILEARTRWRSCLGGSFLRQCRARRLSRNENIVKAPYARLSDFCIAEIHPLFVLRWFSLGEDKPAFLCARTDSAYAIPLIPSLSWFLERGVDFQRSVPETDV
jgi:hypothetical protein